MSPAVRSPGGEHCYVDGREHAFDRGSNLSLLDWLREELGTTGTRRGCDSGHCGACAVMLDGAAVKSCSVLVAEAGDAEIVTIEGLAGRIGPSVDRLLGILRSKPVFQCGFCMPAFVFAAVDLFGRVARPDREAVRNAFDGLICRCTGYQAIVDAVMAAANGTGDTTVLEIPSIPVCPAGPEPARPADPSGQTR